MRLIVWPDILLLLDLVIPHEFTKMSALYVIRVPYNVASNLKILIPVRTAIIIVADVKYARVSMSIPTVNMWCAHTTNPNKPIAIIAKIIPKFPNANFFPLSWQKM